MSDFPKMAKKKPRKPTERPEFFTFPTEEAGIDYAWKAGFSVNTQGNLVTAMRGDQPKRVFVLEPRRVKSLVDEGVYVNAFAWMERKRGGRR